MKVSEQMRPNIRDTLGIAIQDGIEAGWNRLNRDADPPVPITSNILHIIDDEIWCEIMRYFDFDPEEA